MKKKARAVTAKIVDDVARGIETHVEDRGEALKGARFAAEVPKNSPSPFCAWAGIDGAGPL